MNTQKYNTNDLNSTLQYTSIASDFLLSEKNLQSEDITKFGNNNVCLCTIPCPSKNINNKSTKSIQFSYDNIGYG